MASERVQKILAKIGIASRRKAEELISLGDVTINGKVAKLGDKAELGVDAIKVSGKLIQGQAQAKIYVVFYKPKQVISALSDPEGRPSLADYTVRINARVYPVGRLDFTSEGLLLLTNDGEFAEQIQKRDDIPRIYQVKVKCHPDAAMIKRLTRGMRDNRGKMFRPFSVRLTEDLAQKALIEVVMMGAGAVDVKSFVETRGFLVDRIKRVGIGHLTLRSLKPGEFRYLTPTQAYALLEQPELGVKKIQHEADEAKDAAFYREQKLTRAREKEEAETSPAGRGDRKLKVIPKAVKIARPGQPVYKPLDPRANKNDDRSREGKFERQRSNVELEAEGLPIRRATPRPAKPSAVGGVRPPRRDDRPGSSRGPRRDDRSPSTSRGPRRDDRATPGSARASSIRVRKKSR